MATSIEIARQYFEPFDGADFLSPVTRALALREARGDAGAVASMAPAWAVIDPEIEMDVSAVVGEGPLPHFYGYSGFLDFWAEWLPTWEKYTYHVTDYIDCGETIIADVEIRAHALTGSPMNWRVAQACDVRDGKIVRMRFFLSSENALDSLKANGEERTVKARGDG